VWRSSALAATTSTGARAPAKLRFVPICPMTPRRGPAPRDRVVQAGRQIPATGMFGHLVQTATLPGPGVGWPPWCGGLSPGIRRRPRRRCGSVQGFVAGGIVTGDEVQYWFKGGRYAPAAPAGPPTARPPAVARTALRAAAPAPTCPPAQDHGGDPASSPAVHSRPGQPSEPPIVPTVALAAQGRPPGVAPRWATPTLDRAPRRCRRRWLVSRVAWCRARLPGAG
jgi:hypothetical protein